MNVVGWKKRRGVLVLAALLLSCGGLAETKVTGEGWTVLAPDAPDAALPNVLLVGDSILRGYGPALRTLAAGRANVYAWDMAFFGSPGADGIPAERVKAVSAVADFSRVVFNNGLHSLAWDEAAVPDADVAASYRALAASLQAANPKARLFYLATTPYTAGKEADGVVRALGDLDAVVRRLNRFAKAEMLDAGIPYLDAYALLSPSPELAAGDNYHWQSAAYARLARFVATACGWHVPDAPRTVEVDAAVATEDYMVYRYRDGRSGHFDRQTFIVGQGPGPAIYSGFFFPALPTACVVRATLKAPVSESTPLAVNVDAWGLGYVARPTMPAVSYDAAIWADDDMAPWLNGRAPTKLADNLLPAGTRASGTLTADVTAYVARLLDRAGGAAASAVVRLNCDGDPAPDGATGGIYHRFKDATTCPDDPCRFTYEQYADPVAAPVSCFSDAVRAGRAYSAGAAAWAETADAAGVAAAFPAVCGRVDGRDRSAVLRVPFTVDVGKGLLDAALGLAVAPTGAAVMRIPEGVDVDVWALGVETADADADAAPLGVNPFFVGTDDARALLGGRRPVRLGTVARGGAVLLPGQTLEGNGAFRATLRDYLAGWLQEAGAETGAVRRLVLRVNATASAADAGDWGFGVGSVATPGVVSRLETRGDFAVTALPEAADGVVVLESGYSYELTEAAEIPAAVTNIVVPAGARLVFDIAEGASFSLASCVSGAGALVKRGAGDLRLAATRPLGEQYDFASYPVASLRVEAGALHLPARDAYVELNLGDVYVGADAALFLAGGDAPAARATRTIFANLCGPGLVTNGWRQVQALQQRSGTTSTNFCGRIAGNVEHFYVYPSAKTTLTGTDSSFSGGGTLPGFGTLYVAKIGRDANENSSIGRHATVTLYPQGRDAVFGFLGTAGETTEKTLKVWPWSGSDQGFAVLDAGAGGLVWNGDWVFGNLQMACLRLQGDGAATNVFAGGVSECEGASYLEKRGAGTWRLNGDNARRGVTAAKEGTLQFETLRERGAESSLGCATVTHAAYVGQRDDARAVPYALLLGGGKGEATLECVGRTGDATPNAAARRPLALAGSGRLSATCAQTFSLEGVSSVASAPVTLTLDGTCAESRLGVVTNGTSALSLVKEGGGTWTLFDALDFSGALAVNAGTLVVEGPDVLPAPYTWYKYVMKTLNSYYSGNVDTCRVTGEFALYDADGVRRNVGLKMSRAEAEDLQPGEATVVEAAARTYMSPNTWAFDNPSFCLSNMFDDNAGTSSYLAGPGNGTNASHWISVAMRLPDGTPPIVACDVYGNGGTWDKGNRRTVAYSVLGSRDGIAWTELTNQTTNDTARFASGWYSDGTAFAAGAVRTLAEGHGIPIASRPASSVSAGAAQLGRVASISVAAGATLRAVGTVALKTLTVPENGRAGAVAGFTVAADGALFAPGELAWGAALPYAFSEMKEAANFRTWTLWEGGVRSRKRLSLRGGSLVAGGDSFLMIVR